MSELSKQNTLPQHDTLAIEDDRVTSLLADPEIQQGLADTETSIAGYYQSLETEGKHVEPVLRGVTGDGDCVVVTKVSDAPDQSTRYSVFAYRLEDVAKLGFAQALSPRELGDVNVYSGSGIKIDIAKPGQKITVTRETLRAAKDLSRSDREAYRALLLQHSEQSKAADKLHLPQVYPDTPSFNGQLITPLEDVAFGKRRQAVFDRTVAPLVAERDKHVIAWATGDKEAKDKEKAAMELLADRIHKTAAIMRANPQMVDQAGELVFDPAKAEYEAHEVNNVSPRKAGQIAVRAAAAYDANPLGVFEEPAKGKGLFGRLRQ